MRWLAALALASIAAPAVAQDDPQPDYYGVWKGTIGTYPVMACAAADGFGKVRGAYYYLSRLTPLGLAGREDGADWDEQLDYDATGARWRSVTVKGDTLSGNWTQGKKVLPIRLERQKWQGLNSDDGPCMGDAFITPRAGGGAVASSDAVFGHWAYRKLTYVAGKQFGENGSIETVGFTSEEPGDKAINAALAKDLPDGTYRSDFLQCLSFEVANSGSDGYYGLSAEPDFVSARWLDLAVSYENSCGGAHPNAWYSFRTFDRQSGAEVNLFHWLNDKAVEHIAGDQPQYDADTLKPPLRELALAHAPAASEGQDAECPDGTRETEFWYLGLAADGLQLVPNLPHAIMACAETYIVPWAELAPYLSAEGKAGAATLR